MTRLAVLAVIAVVIAFIGILTDAGPLRPAPVHAHACGPTEYTVDSSEVPKGMFYTISSGGFSTDYTVTANTDSKVATIDPTSFGGTDGIFNIVARGFGFANGSSTLIRIHWEAPNDASGDCFVLVKITGATPTPRPTPAPTPQPAPGPPPTTKPIVKKGLTYSRYQLGIGVTSLLAGSLLASTGVGAPVAAGLFNVGLSKTIAGYAAGGATALTKTYDPDVLPPERAARDGTALGQGINGIPTIGEIQNFLTGESIASAPPGTPILLVGSGFGLAFTNQVTIGGQLVMSVGLSETELMTGVPIPLLATPLSGPFEDLPKDVEIVVTNESGTSLAAPFMASPLPTPTGPPGSLIGPVFELEAQLHEAMLTWDCTVIGNTKFVPEGRTQFIEDCEEWLAGLPELLSAFEKLLDLLPDLDSESLLLIESLLTPLGDIQDILANELIPGFSDPDADGLPNDWDNCDTVANPDQLDSNTDLVGNACEFLLDLLFGDANCNGSINPVDSLTVLRYDAGLPVTPLSAVCILHTADINCDGEANPVDSLGILRFDAGLPVSQPNDCPLPGSGLVVASTDSGAEFGTLSRGFPGLPPIAWLGLAFAFSALVLTVRRRY